MLNSQTLRFEFVLDPKNSENYEISLLDLIQRDKPQVKTNINKQEIDDIDDMVKRLEEKYGPVAYVKGKRIHVNDFIDQGNGYDACDDFIDDSLKDEAFIVAPDLMTEYGGFFINNEVLKLNDSSFIIDNVEGGKIFQNSSKNKNLQKTVGMKSQSQKLLIQARKRLTTSSKISRKKIVTIIDSIVATNEISDATKVEVVMKTDEKATLNVVQLPNTQGIEADIVQIIDNSVITPPKLVELPVGLSGSILEKIQELTEICEKSKLDGSKIPIHFNSILFELDNLIALSNQKSTKTIRCTVMRYISQYAGIKYDAIIRRISKFKDSKKKENAKPLFKALEDAITEGMVVSMAKYNSDMAEYALKMETQRSAQIVAVSGGNDAPGEQLSEGEIGLKNKQLNKPKVPKRCFLWTGACKTLLFQVTSGEFESYRLSNNKTAPEEYLNKFYQTSVINLFPPKWMTIVKLMKVSQPMLSEFKKCILNGDESTIKPKLEPKQNLGLNGKSALLPKELNPMIDLTEYESKPILSDVKQPSKPLISLPDSHNTNVKSKSIKPTKKVPQLKPVVRCSSINPQGRVTSISSILAPIQTENHTNLKRYSNGSLLMSPVHDNRGINYVELSSSSDQSSPSLSHYQHWHNNNSILEKHCLNNVSPKNTFGTNCNLQSPQLRIFNNDYVHSNSYKIVSELLPQYSGPQSLSELLPITNSRDENRQSYQPITINNQHSSTNQNSIQHVHNNRKQYINALTFDKSIYNPNSLNCSQMIELTLRSPPTARYRQLLPSMYKNNNDDRSQNYRNFQK